MKDNRSLNTKIVFVIALLFELFMALPGIGWFTAVFSGGWLYVAMFIINIIALVVVSSSNRGSVVPPILGIIGSFIGVIPIIGWLIHATVAFLYLVSIIGLSRDFREKEIDDKKEVSREKKEIRNDDKKIRDAEIVE